MQKINIKIFIVLSIVACCGNAFSGKFNMVSNIDLNIPVGTYQKMGIKQVWIHCSLPVELDKSNMPKWVDGKDYKLIQKVYKKFENSGISTFLVVGIWRKTFKGQARKKQKSFYGKDWEYGSFSADTKDIEKKLQFIARELKKYKCFGGICIDDEPAIITGGCFNERTVALYKQKYGLEPPSRKDFEDTKPGLIKSDNPVLTWMTFQRKLMLEFYRKLLLAVRKVDPACPVYTIPSASWISGKTISRPGWTPDKHKMKRLGMLDSVYLQDFHLYNQYCFSVLDENGWSRKVADGLCQYQFTPPNCPRSIVPVYSPDPDGKGISPRAFRRYVLQTYAEGAKGIGYWPASVFSKNIIKIAEELYRNTIEPLCRKTPNLEKLKGRVAVLISNSTNDFLSVWKNNPIERFEHIHKSEALEYYLFKRGIPFDIVFENKINDLRQYSIIIAAGIDYMRIDKAKVLADYVKNGGKLIFDKSTRIRIKGADILDFNTSCWFDALKSQYQRESDLEYQAGILDGLLRKSVPDSLAICRSGSRHVNINYQTDGKVVYLFIVNNDLHGRIETNLRFNKKYKLEEILTRKLFTLSDNFDIKLKVDGLRVFKLISD